MSDLGPALGSIFRHLIGAAGAGVYMTGDEQTALAGALATAVAIVWGVVEKARRPGSGG